MEEAEAAYRQALDIFLEFGDRHSAARAYHQLGAVAQEQRRLEEAEAAYRQALDIYQEESDPLQASVSATQLGQLLAETGRHAEAAIVLLDAALLWHQATGEWMPTALREPQAGTHNHRTGRLRPANRGKDPAGPANVTQLQASTAPKIHSPARPAAPHRPAGHGLPRSGFSQVAKMTEMLVQRCRTVLAERWRYITNNEVTGNLTAAEPAAR